MTQTLTFATVVAVLAALAMWTYFRRRRRDAVLVRLRLDRSAPGAHLMWDIGNVGEAPITVTKLVIHTGPRRQQRTETVSLRLPQVLEPGDHVLLPTDVDWTHGDGPEVSGPGEALIMAAAGRRVALDELTGDGVATLAERIA